MKREIKFRGKRLDNNEWAYGCYLYNWDPTKEENIIREAFIREPLGNIASAYKVDPETVGQFTGLKDRNGVEIYEDDIFKRVDTKDTFKVVWRKDCFLARQLYDSWLKRDVENEKRSCSLSFMTTFEIEVIGNIHQNEQP